MSSNRLIVKSYAGRATSTLQTTTGYTAEIKNSGSGKMINLRDGW